jgi:hypothetical protein
MDLKKKHLKNSSRRRQQISLVMVIFLLPLTCWAQLPEPNADEEDSEPPQTLQKRIINEAFWEYQGGPSSSFLVALEDITSVSIHSYLIEGGTQVLETTVGTSGSLIARFYYIEIPGESTASATLNSASARLKQLTSTAQSRVTGQDQTIWTNVTKSYPTTTHAHTIEYRLHCSSVITAIFDSAKEAWVTGQGARVKVQSRGQ